MLLIRDKSASPLLVVFHCDCGQQGAAWCHPHVTLRGPKLVFTVDLSCELWTQSKSHFSLYVAQRAFTLRYKTCGSLQYVIRRRLAPTSIHLVVLPHYRISRIAGGVFLPWFCYFVIIPHFIHKVFFDTETRYEVKAPPGIRHDGVGASIYIAIVYFLSSIFSPIFFPRFSNGHVDYVGVSEAALAAAILLILSSSVGIYTYVPCLYMN